MSSQSGKALTSINALVTQAITLCEQFKVAKDYSERSRLHEEAKHVLNHQIPRHPGYALFVNKNSEFYEGYVVLCALIKHNETLVLEERFSKLRRNSQSNSQNNSHAAYTNGNSYSSSGAHPAKNGLPTAKQSGKINGNSLLDFETSMNNCVNGFSLTSGNTKRKPVHITDEKPNNDIDLPYPISPKSDGLSDKWLMPEPSNSSHFPVSSGCVEPVNNQKVGETIEIYEISPSILMNKMKYSKILIIDVRFHYQFEHGHINHPIITCFEPSSLRLDMNAHDLEDLLVISDTSEYDSFSMRSQVDLICAYDDCSTKASDSLYLKMCCDALTRSNLRPYILRGGFEAWKRQYPSLIKSIIPIRKPLPKSLGDPLNPPLPIAPPPPVPPQIRQQSPVLPPKERIPDNSIDEPFNKHTLGQSNYGESSNLNNGASFDYVSPPVDGGLERPGLARQISGYSDAPAKSAISSLKVPKKLLPQPQNKELITPSRSPTTRDLPKYEIIPYTEEPVTPILLTSTGLKNLGNTCYMNCILQCLLSIPQLIKPFNDGTYVQFINLKSKLGYQGRFASVFSRFVRAIVYPQGQFFAPYEIKDLSTELRPDSFAGYDQQDCQEFLTFVLDSIHEDLNFNGDKHKYGELTESEEQIREQMGVRAASAVEWERYLEGDTSLITDLFQGQYLSRLQCLTCKRTSTTYNAFSSLSLPIVSPKFLGQQTSLKACFDEFVKPEMLEGDNAWLCPQCKQKRRTAKILQISRLPPVLIIHLKRFKRTGNFNVNKLETAVDYPIKGLDLTQYWPQLKQNELNSKEAEILSKIPSRGQIPPFIYDLRAVTLHHGTLKGGHYTAVVQKPGRGWLYFDDSSVYPVKEQAAVSKNAYVLFYKRRMPL